MPFSTITFESCARASSSAAGNSSQESTLEMPIDDPPRAGLTNTGNPRRPRSESASSSPSASTACSPTGMPPATARFLVRSLSMPAADASTPGPTNGMRDSSSRPWMVPSSPLGPWSTGNTTSTTS